MTTEKHDPWALLREAREAIPCQFPNDRRCRCSGCVTRARIDAALAESRDSATGDVEWHGAEAATQTATLPNGEVWVYPAASVNYFWCVRRIVNGQERRDVGSAMTVAEAKSAAIEAARGMK